MRTHKSFNIWLLLACFVFSKGIIPLGFMPGSAQQGEWVVLCSVNGTKNVFVPQLGLALESTEQGAGVSNAQTQHSAGFDESCFSSLGSIAFAQPYAASLFLDVRHPLHFRSALNTPTLRYHYPSFVIRGPPSLIS